MGAEQLPACDGDDTGVGAGEPPHSPTVKDEEHCAMDAPPPLYDGIDDGVRVAGSRVTRARAFQALGLSLEVSAALWAFQQAVSVGALDGTVDCSRGGHLAMLYSSSRAVDECNGPIEEDDIFFQLHR